MGASAGRVHGYAHCHSMCKVRAQLQDRCACTKRQSALDACCAYILMCARSKALADCEIAMSCHHSTTRHPMRIPPAFIPLVSFSYTCCGQVLRLKISLSFISYLFSEISHGQTISAIAQASERILNNRQDIEASDVHGDDRRLKPTAQQYFTQANSE